MTLERIIVLIKILHQEITFMCYIIMGKFIIFVGRGEKLGENRIELGV